MTKEHQQQHSHGSEDRPWELYFAIASGITYFSGLIAEFAIKAPDAVVVGLYLATYVFGGFFTVKETYEQIRRGKFEVDFLMVVAALGAASIGRFGEGAVLLFLFSLGHSLEEYAMSRATKSISALGELAPRYATVKHRDGSTTEVPVEELQVGDTVQVKPNSRVPADGFIVAGTTSIDQSAVTGESIPVEKFPVADRTAIAQGQAKAPKAATVFAGTVNGAGAFEMAVTAAAEDSTLSRVVQLVENADVAQSPTQRFIDRFQTWYVPAVIAGVLLTLLVGVLALHEPFADSFYRAMTILVAASPCALAIATPAAVLSAISRAASAGVLVKGGLPLEVLGKVDVIAFDKTGTLTWGQPSLADVIPAPGVPLSELESATLAVESLSDHPLAEAIVWALSPRVPAEQRQVAESLTALPGRGVSAVLNGEKILIGNLTMMADAGVELPAQLREDVTRMQNMGQTTMVVQGEQRTLGVIGVMDQPRLESKETLNELRRSGVSRLVMLSGDNQNVAQSVGALVGVDDAVGELLPEDKVIKVKELGSGTMVTAVVGDGVNDAPAMANADVAIAMGAAGSAVALETADIALMADDLGKVPFLRRLSHATTAIIRQNLIIALVVVALLVPAGLMGLAIGPVVIFHEGSTLIVVMNALRLLRFDKGKEHEGIVHEDRPQRVA